MSDYSAPYMPLFAWQLDDDTAITVTANSVTTALVAVTADAWGYSGSGGTLPSATAAADSVAYAVRTALISHTEIAGCSASYVWTEGATGAGPVIRLDITTDSSISTAPTLAVTGANADRLGVLSSPVTATALASLPTTQWRFQFGPCAGFWWPAQTNAMDSTGIIRAAFVAQGLANGGGEVALWGQRLDIAVVLPVVHGARVSVIRRQSAGYAAQINAPTTQLNDLLDAMLDAAATNHAIRLYYDADTYRTGKLLNQAMLGDVRTAMESQASADMLSRITVALTGVA